MYKASENSFLPQLPSVDELQAFIASANRDFDNSKASAMKAAANAYLVWYHAESSNAEAAAKKWLDEAIAKRNAEIEAHNNTIDHRKARAKLFAENKLNDPLREDQKVQLQADGRLKTVDWTKLKHLKIEARDGASTFTRLVKYVFKFDEPSHASHTSRYAKVLDYIEQHKDQLTELTVEAIVELLSKAGGFEAAIDHMRGNSSGDIDKVRAAKLSVIKNAINCADTRAQLNFSAKFAYGDYVFLLGRQQDGQISVCGELDLNDNEAEALIMKIDDAVIGDLDPFAEFVARVCNLGELVREGQDSTITTDGTQAGKKHKVTGAYSMCDDQGKAYLVVSARYTDASAVIHAYPKPELDIGTVMQGQY